MRDLHDLFLNLTLMIALVAAYQVVLSRFMLGSRLAQFLFGLACGSVAVIGMMYPLMITQGLIFDGRTVVLSLAGLIGGPIVAAVAALVAGAYRLGLGGSGQLVGLMAILASAAIGIAFHYIRQHRGRPLNALQLFGFGLLVQIVVLVLFVLLPDGLVLIRRLAPYLLLAYPLATMLIGLLFQDYEAQMRSRQRLHRLAYYDALTGLPNRAMLTERLAKVLRNPRTADETGVLVILNIDRFKTVNDARGHATGDALLRALGQRLQDLIEESDVLARMGSDEFALMLERSADDLPGVQRFIGEVETACRAPLQIGEEELAVSVSLGATVFLPGDGDSASEVLRRADTALHYAKQQGGNRCIFFDATMSAEAERRFAVERALRTAIISGDLRLHLQTQVEPDGTPVGAEVLVRWQHPEKGLIVPAEFIPIAEESDLIVAVDDWVFTESCRLLTRKPLSDLSLTLSVNISPRHFRQHNFVAWVEEVLHKTGADPKRIVLEITEGLLLDHKTDAAEKMNTLVSLGLRFSIDDFGTGYSSLYYLKRLPIHEIKIDKSFVQDAPVDPGDVTLIETMLAIAERLSLKVVAEGIETEEQARFFDRHDGVIRQGYLYARPEPAEEWLRRVGEAPNRFSPGGLA